MEKLKQQELEKRLECILEIYKNLGVAFDRAWELIPDFPGKQSKGQWIKDKVLDNLELQKLMDGLENNCPPKFMLVGRTGMGKSSLINALCDTYCAEVSDTEIGTSKTETHEIKKDGKVILQVLDTRGIAEGNPISKHSAEKELQESVYRFQPNLILFLCNISSHDDSINHDVHEIQELNRAYYHHFGTEIPVISVLNKTDILPPGSERLAKQYSKEKKELIEDNIVRYRESFDRLSFCPKDIIAVSSSIDWGRPHKELNKMTPGELENLVPKEDCRYNIDKLRDAITSSLPNNAAMGFLMVGKFDTVLQRIARHFVDCFAGIAGMVAATPIPFSDLPVLWTLEVAMVTLVAAIGGENLSIKAARKFLFSVLGIVGVGFAAQQFAKFLNAMIPAGGSVCSAGIATGTMKLLGEAAIKYYINHEDMRKIRKETKVQMDILRKVNQA